MAALICFSNLSKVYAGCKSPSLNQVNLEINEGEIFALLGRNGAGKSTLINILCGITLPTSGSLRVGGLDVIKDYRTVRAAIGLMPQELIVERNQTVWRSVNFSRGLFGRSPDRTYLQGVLNELGLSDVMTAQIMTLSGGMRRRLMLAKALAHQPRILVLDEPTAGVDIELRKRTWEIVQSLRERGVTIILTTHYIEEAEMIADRIGVISRGEVILVKDKSLLMEEFGRRVVTFRLRHRLNSIPTTLHGSSWVLSPDGQHLACAIPNDGTKIGVAGVLDAISKAEIGVTDIETTRSSLEDIYVELLSRQS